MNPEAGPSSRPLENGDSSDTPMELDAEGETSVVNGESTSGFKGKAKEIDRDAVRLVNLGSEPSTGPTTGTTSSSSTRFLALSPIPSPTRQNPLVTVDKIPIRRRSSRETDSSNLDTASSTTLPMGRPLPDPTPAQPPAKRFRPLGPTPLPPGPPTLQHLRILLEPEHVDMNRPRQFFDYLRRRDDQPLNLVLGPAEIKEILDKMRRVNEIWLRTMGEDEACVSCISGWLKEFISSKTPKLYEGIVSPAIWVILKAKPPLKVLKSKGLATLARQCIAIAQKENLSKKEEIEKVVLHLDELIASMRKNPSSSPTGTSTSGSGTASTSTASGSAGAAKPANPIPNLKRTHASSALPGGAAVSPSTSSVPTTFGLVPGSAPLNDLERLLAKVMPVVSTLPKVEPTAGPSQRPLPPSMPMVTPKLEPGGVSHRPAPSIGAGPSSAFRPAAGPTPMVIKREPGLPPAAGTNPYQPRGSNSGPSTTSAASTGTASYPSDNNRWSSVATPAGRNRPFDEKRKPNYRNNVIRYRDDALAEARLFVQDEGEEEWIPPWLKDAKPGESGQPGGNLDREEGHTMRHLHGHEPAIEWYEPPVYDTQQTAVQSVQTAECLDQDQRERPILSAYYRERSNIPPTPDESNVRLIQAGHGTLYIPQLPRAFIPRPQALPPQLAMFRAPPPQPPQHPQGFGGAYRPREPPSNNYPAPTATSSSFRPRNPIPAAPAPAPSGMSSAYRPRDRGASAPAPLVPKQEPADPPIRRATTPGPGGNVIIQQWESDSNNPTPTLDLQGTIRQWRRETRPRRSALLNPLTPQQIAENLMHARNAPPFPYIGIDLEGDDEDVKPGPAYQG